MCTSRHYVCILKWKSISFVLFRWLPTPGERTGERTATSVSLVGTMSARLKHLWLVRGAGSRWRTCTTIITTTVADTFRDTADYKTPTRPLFLIPPIAGFYPTGEPQNQESQSFSTSPYPSSWLGQPQNQPQSPWTLFFIPYFALGINTTPRFPRLHSFKRTTLPTLPVTQGLWHQKKQR